MDSLFKTDYLGEVFEISDVKLYNHTVSWEQVVPVLLRDVADDAKIIICTYSCPYIDFVERMIDARFSNLTLLVHKDYKWVEWKLKHIRPNVRVVPLSNFHSKEMLIEPDVVFTTSANFAPNVGWCEHAMSYHSRFAYRFRKEELCRHNNLDL